MTKSIEMSNEILIGILIIFIGKTFNGFDGIFIGILLGFLLVKICLKFILVKNI